MSRRHRKPDEESSLELLLDTMCNTFGGVMFIAISLFVVISAMTQSAAPEKTVRETHSSAELRTEIARLETLLKEIQERFALQQQELAIREDAPEQKQLREIALLEKLIQERKIKRELLRTRLQTDELTRRELADRAEKLRDELRDRELRRTVQEQEIRRLEQALQALAAAPSEHLKINFKVMQSSEKAPFFLLLRGDRAWPVGPWIHDKDHRPDDAVTVQTGVQNGHRVVICAPRPERGIPVLSHGELTPEFRTMLKAVPADRVPKFMIPPESAATGYQLRECLKKADIPHGCGLEADNDPKFVYIYEDNVNYEY